MGSSAPCAPHHCTQRTGLCHPVPPGYPGEEGLALSPLSAHSPESQHKREDDLKKEKKESHILY